MCGGEEHPFVVPGIYAFILAYSSLPVCAPSWASTRNLDVSGRPAGEGEDPGQGVL